VNFYIAFVLIIFLAYIIFLVPEYFRCRNNNNNQYKRERFDRFSRKFYDNIKDNNRIEVEVQKNIDRTNRIVNIFFYISIGITVISLLVDVIFNGLLLQSEVFRYLIAFGPILNIFCLETMIGRYFDKKNTNEKIKDWKYYFANGNITIRSANSHDFIFYKNWYKNSRWNENFVEELTEKEIELMIYSDSKFNYIFIVNINGKNYGEIILNRDEFFIIKENAYKKPFYTIWMNYHEKLSSGKISEILRYFIDSLKTSGFKIGSLITVINEEIEKCYEENYISNGFQLIENKSIKNNMEKFHLRKGMKNRFSEGKILAKKFEKQNGT